MVSQEKKSRRKKGRLFRIKTKTKVFKKHLTRRKRQGEGDREREERRMRERGKEREREERREPKGESHKRHTQHTAANEKHVKSCLHMKE